MANFYDKWFSTHFNEKWIVSILFKNLFSSISIKISLWSILLRELIMLNFDKELLIYIKNELWSTVMKNICYFHIKIENKFSLKLKKKESILLKTQQWKWLWSKIVHLKMVANYTVSALSFDFSPVVPRSWIHWTVTEEIILKMFSKSL